MWDQTQIMAAIESAKDDLGEAVTVVEASVVGGNLRLALRDAQGDLLAVYSAAPGGDPTRLGD